MPGDLELRVTIGGLLDSQTELFAARDALVHMEDGTRFTYREFKDECDRVARGLMALGIEKGQHGGIWATNYSEWVLAQFATAKIGAVLYSFQANLVCLFQKKWCIMAFPKGPS